MKTIDQEQNELWTTLEIRETIISSIIHTHKKSSLKTCSWEE